MSGVIYEDGTQYEKCCVCGGYQKIEKLLDVHNKRGELVAEVCSPTCVNIGRYVYAYHKYSYAGPIRG